MQENNKSIIVVKLVCFCTLRKKCVYFEKWGSSITYYKYIGFYIKIFEFYFELELNTLVLVLSNPQSTAPTA